jgi:hypothetical protein
MISLVVITIVVVAVWASAGGLDEIQSNPPHTAVNSE